MLKLDATLLGGVKLRPAADKMRDASKPVYVAALDSVESRQQIVDIWFDTNCELWMQWLGTETFASRFLAMSPAEAAAICHVYERTQLQRPPRPIDAEHAATLAGIHARLDAVMDEVKALSGGGSSVDRSDARLCEPDSVVFVKTSCRSPKDTVLYNARFKSRIIECLGTHTAAHGRTPATASDNDYMNALFSASIDMLQSRDAAEVLATFTSSERVFTDLSTALEFQAVKGWKQSFVVRQWRDIAADLEFRGFVVNGKLNALSQYNHVFYSARLHRAAERASNAICKYFYQTVNPLLSAHFDAYVIDFAVCGALGADVHELTDEHFAQLKVIELNPFAPTTDAALFSWSAEEAVLSGASGGYVFRVRESEPANARAALMDSWRTLLEQVTADVRRANT